MIRNLVVMRYITTSLLLLSFAFATGQTKRVYESNTTRTVFFVEDTATKVAFNLDVIKITHSSYLTKKYVLQEGIAPDEWHLWQAEREGTWDLWDKVDDTDRIDKVEYKTSKFKRITKRYKILYLYNNKDFKY